MAEAARKNKSLLMEAMITTFNPNFRVIVGKIEEIAPVRQYSSYFCQYSSKYEALKKGTVASCFQPRTAGSLRDIGIYTLYPLLSVFGRPNSIKADLTPYETPEGVTDIHGTMQLHYGDMTASLVFSKVCDSFQPTEIAGENGNLIIDEIRIARKAEIVYHIPPTSGLGPKAGRTLIHEGLEHDAYYYEMKEFADLVEAGETESKINSLDTSIIAMEIIDEALEQNGLC
jgi:predicted dehydrogenase